MSTHRLPAGDDPVRLLKSASEAKLTTAEGESVPVRIARRGERSVVLVLLLDAAEARDAQRVEQLVLECACANGVVRLLGEVEPVGADSVSFRVLDMLEVRQRRDFVRVTAVRPVAVAIGEGNPVETFSIDVSGGGMLLSGPEGLEMDQRVDFRLSVSEGEAPIEGSGRVVRLAEDGRRAIVFEEIAEGDRERLIHFTFEAQRIARARTRGEL